jgi:tRNA threonylcarbamoyladenosine biosynthesis protein TsaB
LRFAAINTSTDLLCLALFEGPRLEAERCLELPMRQSEGLLPGLDALLKAQGWSADSLEALALSLGPGSFTGLRGGLAMAKGAAQARGVKVLGVGELMARAERLTAGAELPVTVWLDARHGQVYRAAYQRQAQGWDVLRAPAMLALEDAARELEGPHLLTGDALERLAPQVAQSGVLAFCRAAPLELRGADAASVGRLAWARLSQGSSDDPLLLEPLYLRRSEAEIKWGQLHPPARSA